ncbi:MAG TPA: glycosyltransferase family 4 protein [Jatrophihabitans sp.]|jgi:glycosyltransferase involved in cell wall biosynthesis|nr:glycosyltransferase family 4 protein [Jatrophihabitans sp.]
MSTPDPTRTVHVIVPDAIDDPARPSGGNRYDRRLCSGLAAAGWQVSEHAVPDAWPRLGAAGARVAQRVVAELPDGAVVLVDGLIASAGAQVFVPAAGRLSLVVLLHMPLGEGPPGRAAEAAVLSAARAVIATSGWTRDRLLADYPLAADAVHVAAPGVDPAPRASGSAHGGQLVCVAAVAPHKGQDVLVAALTALADQPWRCVCVGPLDGDPAFVARVRRAIDAAGLSDRLHLAGPLTGAALEQAYCAADVLVHPSRGETYGMVVTEALARGVPVIAAASGGLPDALGRAPDGARPGMLVPPDDAGALTVALRDWLTDQGTRHRLRHAALARRATLPSWAATTEQVAGVLSAAAA